MPKKKETKLGFYTGHEKAGCCKPGGPFILQHPPLALFRTSGRRVYSLTNVLQLKKRAGEKKKKCQTEKRTMCLSTILTAAEAAHRQARISWKRAGRTEEDVHLSHGQGRMIDSLCGPIGLHTFSLGRFSVNGGFSLSGGVAWERLVAVSVL